MTKKYSCVTLTAVTANPILLMLAENRLPSKTQCLTYHEGGEKSNFLDLVHFELENLRDW